METNRLPTPEDLKVAEELLKYNKAINESVTGYLDMRRKIYSLEREIYYTEVARQALIDEGVDARQIEAIDKQLKSMKENLNVQRRVFAEASRGRVVISEIYKAGSVAYGAMFANLAGYLLEAQKSFKVLNREIGLSGERSNILMSNLEKSTKHANSLGLTYKDLVEMQRIYSDNLGRAVLLSERNFKQISSITQGLGISVDQSASLVANFEGMGISIEGSYDILENMVKTSRSFGVSTSKVFKIFNDNIGKAQRFNFKNGVDGLLKMSQHSAKFKINMDGVFNAMTKANSLEGAIEMASNLQVLGGKFAQMDAFKLLYNARNDPFEFTKNLSEVTKGMAKFNNLTGEFAINAGDLDRLRLFAEATGQSFDDIVKQTKEIAKMDSISDKIFGKGLTTKQKEYIQGIAQIQKDGSFKVSLGEKGMKDIRDITAGEINKMMLVNDGLEAMAKQAQTFDEVWKNTLNELKSILLPFLKDLNKVTNILADNKELVKAVVGIGAAAYGLSVSVKMLTNVSKGFGQLTEFLGKSPTTPVEGRGGNSIFDKLKNLFSRNRNQNPNAPTRPNTSPSSPSGGSGGFGGGNNPQNTNPSGIKKFMEGIKGSHKEMLAFGAAMLMVGGGIWLVTNGLSTMIEKFAVLNNEQLKGVTTTMAWLGVGLLGVAGAIVALGIAGKASAVGLLAIGGAFMLIGSGIGIASAGIGYMIDKIGNLMTNFNNLTSPMTLSSILTISSSLKDIGVSIAYIGKQANSSGFALFTNQIKSLNNSIDESKFNSIVFASSSLSNFTNSLNSISEAKLDKLIELTKSFTNAKGFDSMLDRFEKILDKKVEVVFKDKEFEIVINNDIMLDSQKLGKKITKVVTTNINNSKKGSVM